MQVRKSKRLTRGFVFSGHVLFGQRRRASHNASYLAYAQMLGCLLCSILIIYLLITCSFQPPLLHFHAYFSHFRYPSNSAMTTLQVQYIYTKTYKYYWYGQLSWTQPSGLYLCVCDVCVFLCAHVTSSNVELLIT